MFVHKLLKCIMVYLSPCFCHEVKKHLADLGGPKFIDQKMFHRFIEDWDEIGCVMKFDVCELNYVCFMSLLQMFQKWNNSFWVS